MPLNVTLQQIALRLLLALAASFLIGYDRDERGKSSGIRTAMLVCLAATLAMLQANLLINSTGKAHDSFVTLDPMRLPLGILSGIGFIGAGAILRKDGLVRGLTTAATLWFVTVLGLLFGGGQLGLALTGTAIALFILWFLKRLENHLPTHRTGTIHLELAPSESIEGVFTESEFRTLFHNAGCSIATWETQYIGSALHSLTCDLLWSCQGSDEPSTPPVLRELASSASVTALTWKS